MQLRKLILAILTAFCAQAAVAQSMFTTNQVETLLTNPIPGRVEKVISLQDCIQLALQHNFDIQIQRYNPDIAGLSLNAAYYGYDPLLSLSATRSHSSQPGNINVNTNLNFGGSTSDTESYSAGLSGSLPTGLSYSSSLPFSKNQSSSAVSTTPTYWSVSQAGFTQLSQPLLRNAWVDSTRLAIKIDKLALKSSQQALIQQIITSVTSVETAYYNLISARQSVSANARSLQLAQQLATENSTKVQIGTLAPLDEKQAESQAAASEAAVLASQQALIVQENTLKTLLSDNYTEWTSVAPVPAEQLQAVAQTLNKQESWRIALSQRPDLLQERLTLEEQNITLKYDLNQELPSLDIIGSYGRNALSPSLGTALNNARDGLNESWSYGATFSIPLGNGLARDTYKKQKVTVKQALLTLKQLEQSVVFTIDNDIGAVQTAYQQVQSTHAATVYAEDALTAERTKLENGKSTSFQVLQLISNLTSARLSEIQALANYNIARATLEKDQGTTLQSKGIDVKSH